MSEHDLTIIGDGVVAWACAHRLAVAGRRVLVLGAGDPPASLAAAGMIAPASEAVLDGVDASTAQLWRRSAEAWRALSAELGISLRQTGTLHLADAAELERRAEIARSLGFAASRSSDGLLLADDMLIEPSAALRALRGAALAAGAVFRRARAPAAPDLAQQTEATLRGGRVLIAAGWGAAALTAWAPELAALHPIRGQLLRVAAPDARGPMLRAQGVYLAPQTGGWSVGATMEPGRSDLEPDPARSTELLAAAAALRPELADAPFAPVVGVRAATQDGAPLIGPSRTPGVLLATGLRRNGWLLAPLVAQVIAAYEDGDPDAVLGGQAHAWAPARVLQTP